MIKARDNPDVEIDLGLAEADWLILWSVEWEELPDLKSEEPDIPVPDKSSSRWQEICRQQQKEIIIRQFDIIQGRY